MKSIKTKMVLATLLALILTITIPISAYAHITVEPATATKGGYGTFSIKVPSHHDTQNTVKVELEIPQDTPITSVQVAPTPGWTYSFERTTLDEPLENHGHAITEVISKIIWEGGQVKPNEFVEFKISLGRLPSDVDSLVLKAIQIYDGDKVDSWIEETIDGQDEPEFPAPIVTLLDSGDVDNSHEVASSDSASEESSSDMLSIVALIVAVLSLLVATTSIMRSKKS